MTRSEFARLWPDIVYLKPQKVILTGGEPLMRGDILGLLADLLEADPGHVISRCLNTNGHHVTSVLARQLVGLVDEVRVSIDALEERNDRLRGDGNFRAALQALETFYEAGFEPKALVTLTSEGLPDLEELISLLVSMKIRRININVFRPIGRGKSHRALQTDLRAARAAVDRAMGRSQLGSKYSAPQVGSEGPVSCGAGQFLNIMPNGDVFPCHVLTQREFRCGNLRNQSLVQICGQMRLLGQLSRLNLRELASMAPRLAELAKPDPCMGNVYATTRDVPAWKEKLPGLGHGG
jgi:MoaA/NifB/PqqE/SkfB family radical SAM enzyme